MSTGSRKKRPRHSTSEKERMAKKIVQLRKAGKSWEEVVEDQDIHVSVRQAQRLHSEIAKKSNLFSPDDFEGWTISYSKQKDDPPEKVRFLLQLQEKPLEFPAEMDVVTLNWAWYLHSVDPSLPAQTLAVLSTRYAYADNFSRDNWLYPILDLAVRKKPWQGLKRAYVFFREATGIVWENGYRPARDTELMAISDLDLELVWAHRRGGGKRPGAYKANPYMDPSFVGLPIGWEADFDRDVDPNVAKLMHRRVSCGYQDDPGFTTLPEWGSKERHSSLFVMTAGADLYQLLNNNPFSENQEEE